MVTKWGASWSTVVHPPSNTTMWRGGEGAVFAPTGAKISWARPGGGNRGPGRPPRGPGPAIADAFAALDIADLRDAGLHFDHRLPRIVEPRARSGHIRP